MDNEIFYEEIEHLKRMLREYGYQCRRYSQKKQEVESLDVEINDETGVKGVGYSGTTSTTVTVTPYINELIVKQASAEFEMKKAQKEAERIWKKEHIEDRLKVLSDLEKEIIELRYTECLSQIKVAEILQYEDQSFISKKEKRALKKMLKVEI